MGHAGRSGQVMGEMWFTVPWHRVLNHVPVAVLPLRQTHTVIATFPFSALTPWLGDRKGIRPVKHCVLVCWWRQSDCSIPQFTAPVVTTTSIILSFNTRSSADADNGLDAFSSQSRSTNMVPFSVHCDFSLSMWSAPRTKKLTNSLRHFHSSSVL